MGSTLTLPTPPRFDLARAVCSYGYFLLAPNRWDPDTQTLTRPLRGRDDRLIHVTLRQPRRQRRLVLACDVRLDRTEQQRVKRDVVRMLRIDEDLTDWFARHPEARKQGFGRLFRSPTLFEDIVKTITGCNVTWRNTMTMNRLLCQAYGDGGFPTPEQIAPARPDHFKQRTKTGYRAGRIVQLARDVVEGRLDLAWFEAPQRTSEELFAALLELHGIGPYAAANLCQLLGHYDRLAIDTETYRHYCHVHGVERPKDPTRLHRQIAAHYGRFGAHAFRAYWFELWQDYQRRFGDARKWDADLHGPNFTASNLR